MRHHFTWRGFCGFDIEAGTVADAVQKAIADKPKYIPPGTGLFYGMAGGSNAGAVYVVPNHRFRAEIFNQFKRRLGDGFADMEQEAIRLANERADAELRSSNPNWKWRKAKTTCRINTLPA